jgi:ankyrin repeat protein
MTLLLAAGAQTGTLDQNGRTVLEAAIRSGNGDCVTLAVAHGGDITKPASNGDSLLRYAIKEKRPDSVKALLQAGCDAREKNQYGLNLLHQAAEIDCPDIIPLLAAAGVDVNAKAEYDRPPLWYAVLSRKAANAEALLKAGADVFIEWGEREPLLHHVVSFSDSAMAKVLLDGGANIYTTDKHDHSALRHALRFSKSNAATVEVLLDAGADTRHQSRNDKDQYVTDREYAQTLCPEVRDAVEAAARKFDLLDAAEEGDQKAFEKLLDEGVPINASGADKVTALFLACAHLRTDIVRIALARGAGPLLLPDGASSLMFYAAKTGGAAIITMLGEAGVPADPEGDGSKDDGVSALVAACKTGHAPTVKALLRAGAKPERASWNGWLPMIAAVESGSLACVEALVEYGAKVGVTMKGGRTPLGDAEASGKDAMIDLLKACRRNEIDALASDATQLSQKVSTLKTLRFKISP